MEKTGIDNKLMKDLHKFVKDTSVAIPKAMDVAEQALKESMTDKEYDKYKAFQKKYLKLHSEGKFKEAEELKKYYNGEPV